MSKKKEIPGLNIALLDILTWALGAVIILFVTIPKAIVNKEPVEKSRGPLSVTQEDVSKLYDKITAREEVIIKLKAKIQTIEEEAKAQNDKQGAEIKELQAQVVKAQSILKKSEESDYRVEGIPMDVGFDFKGKKFFFFIDVSGSMNKEDRIGQVKAGLKMLITSMPVEYKLDVVSFPNHPTSFYSALYGEMRALDEYNKNRIYQYLLNLRAVGYTPTADVLKYAFKTYPDATDFVILSDGAPTIGNSRDPDNIANILLSVKNMNHNNIRISTIGVGSAFLNKKDSSAYVFLNELAKEHGGFFVGF